MEDLQELFENMSTKDFNELSDKMEKKSLTPQSIEKILDYIAKVYCAEKEVEEAELSKEQMDELVEAFSLSVSLYVGVLRGHMEIKKGRIKLTNGGACKLSLTKEGIKHVENMIGKKG